MAPSATPPDDPPPDLGLNDVVLDVLSAALLYAPGSPVAPKTLATLRTTLARNVSMAILRCTPAVPVPSTCFLAKLTMEPAKMASALTSAHGTRTSAHTLVTMTKALLSQVFVRLASGKLGKQLLTFTLRIHIHGDKTSMQTERDADGMSTALVFVNQVVRALRRIKHARVTATLQALQPTATDGTVTWDMVDAWLAAQLKPRSRHGAAHVETVQNLTHALTRALDRCARAVRAAQTTGALVPAADTTASGDITLDDPPVLAEAVASGTEATLHETMPALRAVVQRTLAVLHDRCTPRTRERLFSRAAWGWGARVAPA